MKLEVKCIKVLIIVHLRGFIEKYASLQKDCIVETLVIVQSGSIILGVDVLVAAGRSIFTGDYLHTDVGSIVKSTSPMKPERKF